MVKTLTKVFLSGHVSTPAEAQRPFEQFSRRFVLFQQY